MTRFQFTDRLMPSAWVYQAVGRYTSSPSVFADSILDPPASNSGLMVKVPFATLCIAGVGVAERLAKKVWLSFRSVFIDCALRA